MLFNDTIASFHKARAHCYTLPVHNCALNYYVLNGYGLQQLIFFFPLYYRCSLSPQRDLREKCSQHGIIFISVQRWKMA